MSLVIPFEAAKPFDTLPNEICLRLCENFKFGANFDPKWLPKAKNWRFRKIPKKVASNPSLVTFAHYKNDCPCFHKQISQAEARTERHTYTQYPIG